MIAHAIVTLTDSEDLNETSVIEVQYGTEVFGLCGEMVRSFVRCVNKARATWLTRTEEEILAEGLRIIPSETRPLLKHLYEEMKDRINE